MKETIDSVEQAVFTVSSLCFHHIIIALGILPTIIILYRRIKVSLQRYMKCFVVVTICLRMILTYL